MTDHLKNSIVSGIRAGLISFILFLVMDISILSKDNIYNFIMVLVIALISALHICLAVLLVSYAHHTKTLRHVAILMVFLALIVIIFMQYPFIGHLISAEDRPDDIRLHMGKIDSIVHEPIINRSDKPEITIRVS